MNPSTATTISTNNLSQSLATAFDDGYTVSPLTSREEGVNAFRKLGLPGSKTEEYRFTPITRILEKNFKAVDFTNSSPSSFVGIEEYLIPGYECNRIVFVNGQYAEGLSSIVSSPSQVQILPLEEALESDVHAKQYFSKLITPSQDAFAALNAAFWQGGIFVNVPENTRVEKPIFILHLNDAEHSSVVAQTRLLVVIGKGSEVDITEKFNSIGAKSTFTSTVEEIVVQENATLNYHKIQNDANQTCHLAITRIHQYNSSRVNTFTLTLDGQLIRNNLAIIIDGENCESHFYGLYLLHKNTLADNHTVVDHLQPNSLSNELYKGIMDGNSKGVFNGKIYVRQHAQKTNAFQTNRNILLSDTSTVNTKPQLEIWADDVKCSHGCTSGQMDEEALFYLQSRGISRQTARAMVLNAFACEVMSAMKDVTLKNYVDNLVVERLQKNL